jgi:hypothetical protein
MSLMDSVQVMLFEMGRMQQTDPRGFYLMIGCVSLLAFLALTIFGGFIYYLYKGTGKKKSD